MTSRSRPASTLVRRLSQLGLLLVGALLCAVLGAAESTASGQTMRNPTAPDLRKDDTVLKVQRGSFLAVPIPISDPTLGTGLVPVGAYFWPQSEAQSKSQPASVTAVAGLYTSNKSYAYGVGQQNYWGGDRWRFSGAAGRANLKLDLPIPAADAGSTYLTSWLVDGTFLYADISRAVHGRWYGGLIARYVDIDQSFAPTRPESSAYQIDSTVRSVGVGADLTFDSRDMPINSYAGRLLDVRVLFNEQALGGDDNYRTVSASFRSYHTLAPKVVLAWEVVGCGKDGTVPLWDACRLGLRGFPATQYMARSSVFGQVEARWRFRRRWGLVGFGGAGTVGSALVKSENHDVVPSVGVGLRFMVLESKRVNLRLDYARSHSGEAIYFSVGEAF